MPFSKALVPDPSLTPGDIHDEIRAVCPCSNYSGSRGMADLTTSALGAAGRAYPAKTRSLEFGLAYGASSRVTGGTSVPSTGCQEEREGHSL